MTHSARVGCSRAAWVVAVLCALIAATHLAAQTALAQLGLTDASAREFVLNEVKDSTTYRGRPIATFGTRAFLKLPAAARGAAATGLFAWAKTYVNSPAFRTAYAQHRKNVGLSDTAPSTTIDQEVRQKIDADVARFDEMRKESAALPPEMRTRMLELLKVQEELARSPERAAAYRQEVEATRARQGEQDAAMAVRLPATPEHLFARRLREFLDATADVNFSARRVSLTGGPDGIEFLDKADRRRHFMWQLAVIVGPEATAAARASAQAWLAELPR
jgi:hypothetical protein